MLGTPAKFTLGSLRRVLLSGDWIAVSLPDRIRVFAPRARDDQSRWATEAAIWSIYYPIGGSIPAWKSIPYGKPLANQATFLDDQLQRHAPAGAVGEIYIGGAGRGPGYA